MVDTPRITLRQLSLPARLVLSAFLITVGLGYLSAMVQLHMKHSDRNGEPLPTADNLVARFSGLEKPSANSTPSSKIDSLVSGDPKAPDVNHENMAPAFFAKSRGWEAAQGRNRGENVTLEAERETERQSLLAWVRSEAAAKKTAYEADKFPLPAELKGKPFTATFTDGEAVKIRSLINERCAKCHADQGEVSLGSYADLEPLVTPPPQRLIDGKWVRGSKQISVEALTQSTHAHLLSFAMLFTLTGLTFAFTSLPGLVRGTLGPIVLIAQVIDIGCWWLARVPNTGPYFAQAIMGTGTVVAVGLFLQIVLSLFNMYGPKGKIAVLVLLVGGGAGVGYVMVSVIEPALEEEKQDHKLRALQVVKPEPPAFAAAETSQLERLIMGATEPGDGAPFNGKGTMAPAFFGKDSGAYKKQLPKRGDELKEEREGERLTIRDWLKSDPAKRKEYYDADAFPLPEGLKRITPDYVEGKVVKVKTLLEDRCVRCHSKDGEQSDFPLETYEELLKYIDGKPKDAKPIPKAGD